MKIMQKKAIRDLLHANIDVHSRRLIAEFPKYGMKCIEIFQLYCATCALHDALPISAGSSPDDLSDPSLSDDSDSSDDIHYRRRQCKKERHRKKDPIKLCASLTAKFLTTAYKSKIIRLNINEDPLQRRIYFLSFFESLEMIFS